MLANNEKCKIFDILDVPMIDGSDLVIIKIIIRAISHVFFT